MYGQAEASPRISIMPANLITKFPRSVGNPMPGGEVWVEDDKNKKVLKRNFQGNLVYKGKNVFLGYSHSYKDLGKKNEMKNTLKTGDLGFIDKDLRSKEKELKAEGLLSTCIQHEIDHLNGVLFIDYLSKLKKDIIIKKVSKDKKETERVVV